MIIPCIQGSAEWLQLRCGRITASRMADVMNYLKPDKQGNRKESQKRIDYRIELVAERLTGRSTEHFVTRSMQWGTDHEPDARNAYTSFFGIIPEQVGFLIHDSMDYTGSSPDSFIGTNGGLEIKCPDTTTHIEWMMAGGVPEEHQPQMQWNMACSGRQWWDFISYDPRLPADLQSFIARLDRDDNRIAELTEEAEKMHAEVCAVIYQLRHRPTLYTQLRKSLEVEA